jgi:hypothetical protein
MFQIIPGILRSVHIIPRFRLPEYAGIDMGLGRSRYGILVLQGRIHLLEQGYGNGVHKPAEFGLPKVSAADQVQNLEQGWKGTVLSEGEDFARDTPGR